MKGRTIYPHKVFINCWQHFSLDILRHKTSRWISSVIRHLDIHGNNCFASCSLSFLLLDSYYKTIDGSLFFQVGAIFGMCPFSFVATDFNFWILHLLEIEFCIAIRPKFFDILTLHQMSQSYDNCVTYSYIIICSDERYPILCCKIKFILLWEFTILIWTWGFTFRICHNDG